MTKVILNKKIEGHLIDCKRIQDTLYKNGYDATITECFDWWDKLSHKSFSQWLPLPEQDLKLIETIKTQWKK